MTRESVRKRMRDESGFSLVELLVSMILTVVVLAMGGILLGTAMKAQNSIASQATAASVGQLITRSIEVGVRNATAVTVVNDVSGAGTQLLIARTAGRGTTASWSCKAWFYTPAGGGAIYTRSTTPAAVIAAPTSMPNPGWTLIGDGFTSIDPAASTNVFSAPSGRVDLKFVATNRDRAPVLLQTTAYTRKIATESAPCF